MGKKRKIAQSQESKRPGDVSKYGIEEKFDGSEDEFFAGRDKILIDETPATKRKRLVQEQERDLEPSDEEVYYDESNDENEDEEEGVEIEDEVPQDNVENEDEEDDQYWGTSRADYYNADNIETEADALEEEAEARRLQQKQLKSMTEADFGLDEFYSKESNEEKAASRTEKLPDVQLPESATNQERLKFLESRYPEFKPLAKDFVNLQAEYSELKMTTKRTNNASIKFRAISAYLGILAMYFAIFTSNSGNAISPNQLREHPIMKSLIRCKDVWEATKNLDVDDVEAVPEANVDAIVEVVESTPAVTTKAEGGKSRKKRRPSVSSEEDFAEIDDLMDDVLEENSIVKKVSKPARIDLQELLSKTADAQQDSESDFGDENPLTLTEMAEKARKKKTLRFYASQIAQKANRRGAAGREAGGDDDVPHKERLRDKQARLMQEAEKRGRAKADTDLGGDDEYDENVISQNMKEEANEYYDQLVQNSRQKKDDKKAKTEAYAEAARQKGRIHQEEVIGPDGKRKITYAIEKNKGMTPKRKKDARNPRVKKRKKYDEKMKKLGSIRQVYKGGEGKGGYGGELTGIKTNLVRSVKL